MSQPSLRLRTSTSHIIVACLFVVGDLREPTVPRTRRMRAAAVTTAMVMATTTATTTYDDETATSPPPLAGR